MDEELLFRLLAKHFNTKYSKATYIKETHKHKGMIEYYSDILSRNKLIEISDLMILTYNKKVNELRLCFIQAKYKKSSYKNFLNFMGNVYQWELLKDKPDISDVRGLGFPKNILNFTTYKIWCVL